MVLAVPVVLGAVVVPAVVRGREPRHLRGVDLLAGGVLPDRVVDRGLETVLVDHQVGIDDLGRLLRGDLEVVRLGAGLGEVLDGGVRAGDPLRDVLERVEGGDHPDLAAGGPRAGVVGERSAAAQREHTREGECWEERLHDNDSQL